MAKKSTSDSLFCAISSGNNNCSVCFEKAQFSLRLPQVSRRRMELLRCGHGMCSVCYDTMTVDDKNFSCPFCRDSGTFFLESFGSSRLSGRADTFNQWISEFISFKEIMLRSNHPFAVLYRQIVSDFHLKKGTAMQRRAMEKVRSKKAIEKKMREKSQREAICPYCNKDTFTSMKQLGEHIVAKHSSKKSKCSETNGVKMDIQIDDENPVNEFSARIDDICMFDETKIEYGIYNHILRRKIKSNRRRVSKRRGEKTGKISKSFATICATNSSISSGDRR